MTPTPTILRAAVAACTLALALPATAAQDATAAAAAPKAAAIDAAVNEILDAAIKAMGGQKAIDAIETMRAQMAMNVQGMDIEIESMWARAGGRMAKMSTPMGPIEMGSDGTVKWMNGPMGYQLLPEMQEKQLDQQAGLIMDMLEPKRVVRDRLKSIESAGVQTFGGRECDALKCVTKEDETAEIFFDRQTHLPVGYRDPGDETQGVPASSIVVSDWKEIGGVQVFHTVTVESDEAGMGPVTMKIGSVEINAVAADAFKAPDEVKKLVEEKKNATPAAEIKLEDLSAEEQQQATQMLGGLRSMEKARLKQMVAQMEGAMGFVPADQKKVMQYVMQELKKELGNGK